jgi:RNA polymerase sigma factor (sigma-70 family)
MKWTPKTIERAVEQELKNVAQRYGSETATSVHSIVEHNIRKGRLNVYLEGNLGCRPQEYVWLVTENYRQQYGKLYKLQIERSDEEWKPEFDKLQRMAFYFLLRHGFTPGDNTNSIATDYATEAAIALLNAHFPYDTAFEAWETVLLRQVCARQMRVNTRKSVVPDCQLVELEDSLLQYENDPFSDDEEAYKMQLELESLVEQLRSDQQKQFIRWHYFDKLSLAEIEERLAINRNAIYALHFRAIENLRKISDKKGYNNEQE